MSIRVILTKGGFIDFETIEEMWKWHYETRDVQLTPKELLEETIHYMKYGRKYDIDIKEME